MNKCCVFSTLGDDPHTQGLFKAARIAQRAGIATHIMPSGSSESEFFKHIAEYDPEYIAFSYRLSPEKAIKEIEKIFCLLRKHNLLTSQNGKTRRVAIAALPETMTLLRENPSIVPVTFHTMDQDVDLLKRSKRVLDYFNVPEKLSQEILLEIKKEVYPPTIGILDDLAKEVIRGNNYLLEPPLPVPSEQAIISFVKRIKESDNPLIRAHFGIPSDSIVPTIDGIKRIASNRCIDELSLGSSDLSQRFFGQPDAFKKFKNDGGVPYKDFDDLVQLVQATRTGNFPAIKPYAHVVNLVDFIHVCIKAGALIGGHQAVPLFWFNELDGRGPMDLEESIREHFAAVKELARYGIPVEMNDPNQWSSRYAHDTIITTSYALISTVMLYCGVNNIVLQMQFNKPRETGDIADLAKMTAGLELAQMICNNTPVTIFKETRTGIGYFDPDPDIAKYKLARSTLLQMMINPHIIHMVSYCEASHIATPRDVIESSKIVRRSVRVFREHQYDIMKFKDTEEELLRRQYLIDETIFLLKEIVKLKKPTMPTEGMELREFIQHLADPAVLAEAVRREIITAPGIMNETYKPKNTIVTKPTNNGYIDCLYPETGIVMTERERSKLGEQ